MIASYCAIYFLQHSEKYVKIVLSSVIANDIIDFYLIVLLFSQRNKKTNLTEIQKMSQK